MKKRYFVLIILILLLIWYGEKRKFYKASSGNWITVWKTYGGHCFLISGKYYGVWPPSDNVLEIKTGTDLTLFFSSELPQVAVYRTPKKVRVKSHDPSKMRFYHYEDDTIRFDSLFYFRADSSVKKVRTPTRSNSAKLLRMWTTSSLEPAKWISPPAKENCAPSISFSPTFKKFRTESSGPNGPRAFRSSCASKNRSCALP